MLILFPRRRPMKSARFQFRLRTLMAVVVLAALGSVCLAENRLVSEWQAKLMSGDTHVTVDIDDDGRADMVWMELANGRWEKMELPRK